MRIFGDYHIHSEFSRDAVGTIDDIARTARERGLQEIAITDHGPRAFVGCKTKHYDQIRALVDKANKEHSIKVYFGVEANVIGTDGQIDVEQEYRRDIDIVLCGFHRIVRMADFKSFFLFYIPNHFYRTIRWFPKRRVRKNTEIMKNVIEKNDIDIWSHPNLYFKLDVVEVAKTCAQRGTLIELNGKRISFRPIDFERMKSVGAKFVINSDAHEPKMIGRIDRVAEFLKNCDYDIDDIINLSGPFRRGDAKLLEKVQASHDEAEETSVDYETKKAIKQEKKMQKQEAKQKLKRAKIIQGKS